MMNLAVALILTAVLPRQTDQAHKLAIDPRLVVQAAEVWTALGGPENPVWPQWQVQETPLYFYFPGVQELLINHPAPPPGFLPYSGALRFPAGQIFVRNGAGEIQFDGQNTTREIGGVQTLVVADTLSNLRSNLRFLLQDTRPADERSADLTHAYLSADPYAQMGMIAHEAFHAFQSEWIGQRASVELHLLQYPTLNVENNVETALEAEYLRQALESEEYAELEEAALLWLALREKRHARLASGAATYENGVELNEGLAKYVEWRLSEVLEGRVPGPGMEYVANFAGYDDLSFVRQRLLDDMEESLSGRRVVNNDLYGTAPVRFRLYYSGMAIGAMLDRLLPEWKARIVEPGTSLAGLVREALLPDEALLEQMYAQSLEHPQRAALVAAKTELAAAGQRAVEEKLEAVWNGNQTLLLVDYNGLKEEPVGWNFTPFGITVVDAQRTIYGVIPVATQFASGASLRQSVESPLLHDSADKVLVCQLPVRLSPAELVQLLGVQALDERVHAPLMLKLPGVELAAPFARVRATEERIVIELLAKP